MTTLASVLVKGLYANLPTPGMAGRTYFATDTNQTWYDDGTNWTNVTTVPPLPTGSGNKVLASPADGSAGVAVLRAIVPVDMPVLVGDTGSGGTAGAVPAPAAGAAAAGKFLKADGTWSVPGGGSSLPLSIGFVVVSGSPGSDIGPMLIAPRLGSLSKCTVVVKASDSSTALVFRIKQNGVDIFTADPTMAASTASGSVTSFTALTSSPLAVSAGDIFSIDITGGSASWAFTAQLS